MIPATDETRAALAGLIESEPADGPRAAPPLPDRQDRPPLDVLIIAPNEETVVYTPNFVERSSPLGAALPACLRTVLKPHQVEGLDWLRAAWSTGRPGVLLADEMGLGKTLQALAFLALLREAMTRGVMPKRPLLVVAPVGLLANWIEEHDLHLCDGGIGRVCKAYGPGLASLRRPAATEGDPRMLDRPSLAEADWVLTTYETLRDHQVDFGQVRFEAVLFDEAQRIKTPAARVTDAAKAMNAGFTIALTGTPVENRLGDLWCIIDTVQPGCLGELKTFSTRYEQNADEAVLRKLKDELERSTVATPRLMLRRLKVDRLRGLPEKQERRLAVAMPPQQADAYQSALMTARVDRTRAARLRALHQLRSVSLHPVPDSEADDGAFIAASARLIAGVEALDAIAARGEKALVFLESLALQARLVGVFQRRYDLGRAPMVINGEIAGPQRHNRVRDFQCGPSGFDVMILSPRAAGVGLTLTAANHVIHLSRWWNPAVEDQCTDRVHRIGQTRPVTIHLPIALLPGTEARSFDHNLDALLERKRTLAAGLLAAPAPTAEDEDALFRATVGA